MQSPLLISDSQIPSQSRLPSNSTRPATPTVSSGTSKKQSLVALPTAARRQSQQQLQQQYPDLSAISPIRPIRNDDATDSASPVLANQSKKKKKPGSVHFNETVWMSVEQFKTCRVESMTEIKNLRIGQDFDMSKPENCTQFRNGKPVLAAASETASQVYLGSEEQTPHRKMENQIENQRIHTRKVIDDLDLWQSDLNQKKRQVASSISFAKPEQEQKLKQSESAKMLQHPNAALSSNRPGLNTFIIDQIMHPQSSMSEIGFVDSGSVNAIGFDMNVVEEMNNQKYLTSSKVMAQSFPKSINQMPVRPMTLTSLNLKKPNEIKHKAISRYVIDSDNKVMTKSDAQLQAEQNNLIINSIFKHKLQKVIDTVQPSGKAEYLDIVRNQTALFKKDTLSHFKSLHYLHGAASQSDEKGKLIVTNPRDPQHPKYGTIEYGKLYGELFEDKLIKRNVKLEEEKKQLVKQEKYLNDVEDGLLEQYQTIVADIKSIKSRLAQMRLDLNENSQHRKRLDAEVKRISAEFDKKIYEIEKAEVLEMEILLEAKSSRGISIGGSSQNIRKKQSRLWQSNSQSAEQINQIKDEKRRALYMIETQIKQLLNEYTEMSSLVDRLSEENEALKETKKTIKHSLKSHYMNELHRDFMSSSATAKANLRSKKSLVWAVIKLFQIHADVTYNIFPDFMDETSIKFIIEYAQFEQQKGVLKAQLRGISDEPSQFKQNKSSSHNHSSIPFDAIMAQMMAERTKIRRDGFNVINKSSSHTSSGSSLGKSSLQKQQSYQQNHSRKFIESKKIEEQIRKVDEKIEEIKTTEIERIITNAIKESIAAANGASNSSKADQQIQILLTALIGGIEAEKAYLEFQRRRAKLDATIAANRTFNFTTAIHASTASAAQHRSHSQHEHPQLQSSEGLGASTTAPAGTVTLGQASSKKGSNDSESIANQSQLKVNLPETSLDQIKLNQILLGIRTPKTALSSSHPLISPKASSDQQQYALTMASGSKSSFLSDARRQQQGRRHQSQSMVDVQSMLNDGGIVKQQLPSQQTHGKMISFDETATKSSQQSASSSAVSSSTTLLTAGRRADTFYHSRNNSSKSDSKKENHLMSSSATSFNPLNPFLSFRSPSRRPSNFNSPLSSTSSFTPIVHNNN